MDVFVNPKKGDQASNKWITTIWSIQANDLLVSENGEAVGSGSDRDHISGALAKPVRLAVRESKISGVLDTRALVLPKVPLATIVLKHLYMPPLRLWSDATNGFSFSVPLGVHSYEQKGRAIAYISATFIISDANSGRSFWLTVALFDPRANTFLPGGVSWRAKTTDKIFCSPTKGTKIPIVGASAGEKPGFILSQPDSLKLQAQPFKEGTFSFSFGQDELRRVLGALGSQHDWCRIPGEQYDGDLSSYELHQASVMLEAHIGDRTPAKPVIGQYSVLNFTIGRPSLDAREASAAKP